MAALGGVQLISNVPQNVSSFFIGFESFGKILIPHGEGPGTR